MATGYDTTGIEKVTNGGLYVQPFTVSVPDYVDFYDHMTVARNPDPWLKLLFTSHFGCSWETDAEIQCNENMLLNETGFQGGNFVVSLTIDAVNAMAHALHNYIMDKCPMAFMDKTIVKGCMNKEEFLPYVYGVSFIGTSGEILRFDERGKLR